MLTLMFPLSYQNVVNIGLSLYKKYKYETNLYQIHYGTQELQHHQKYLKKAQGEKIAPYVFKINDTQSLQDYLDKEKITYEIYQEVRKIINNKRTLTPTYDEPRKRRKLEDR